MGAPLPDLLGRERVGRFPDPEAAEPRPHRAAERRELCRAVAGEDVPGGARERPVERPAEDRDVEGPGRNPPRQDDLVRRLVGDRQRRLARGGVPFPREDGDRRALKPRDEEPRRRPRPPECRRAGPLLLHAEAGPEEGRRRIPHGDGEEAAVAEPLEDPAAEEPALPSRVDPVGRVGVAGEIGEADDPLVRRKRRGDELRFPVRPAPEAPLPPLGPEEGVEDVVRHDRLAPRVEIALEVADRGDRRRLERRARPDGGIRIDREAGRRGGGHEERQPAPPENRLEPGPEEERRDSRERRPSSATSSGCGGTRARGRAGRGRRARSRAPRRRRFRRKTTPAAATPQKRSARGTERKSRKRNESKKPPTEPAAIA